MFLPNLCLLICLEFNLKLEFSPEKGSVKEKKRSALLDLFLDKTCYATQKIPQKTPFSIRYILREN